MASNQTANYQLNQWEPEDKVLRTDFNADNLKIDGALHALGDEVAAQAAAIAKCGSLKFETLSYVGTGTGSDTPLVLTFSRKPLVLLIHGYRAFLFASRASTTATAIIRDSPQTTLDACTVTWSDNRVTLAASSAYFQMNLSQQTYYAFALYATDEA